MRYTRFLLLFSTFLLFFYTLSAQIPAGYYNQAVGKKGKELQKSLSAIVDNHHVIKYADLWTCFAKTDMRADSTIWDIYGDNPNDSLSSRFVALEDQCTTGGTTGEGECYSREHLFCQSWLKPNSATGTTTPGSDLFHIYPVDGYINTRRNNNTFGEVEAPKWTSRNGSKLGTNSFEGAPAHTAFEPIDEYKGDIARSFFYMATRYMLEDGEFATDQDMVYKSQLRPWAIKMLLNWHLIDPVSEKEKNRNNAIYQLQGNRNPFIDHPELVAKIWDADSVNPFQLEIEDEPLRPKVIYCDIVDRNTLKLGFDTKMKVASLEDRANYSFSSGANSVSTAHFANDTLTLQLKSPLEMGKTYYLIVRRLQAENLYFLSDTSLRIYYGGISQQGIIAAWTFDSLQYKIKDKCFTADINLCDAHLYANGKFGSSDYAVPEQLTAFSGTTIGDPRGEKAFSGASMAVQNKSANQQALVLKFSTKNYQHLKLSIVMWKTNAGFETHDWSWSTNGTDFNSFTFNSVPKLEKTYELKTMDLSMEESLDNQDSVYLRIRFDGATAPNGNNRLDNIVISASPMDTDTTTNIQGYILDNPLLIYPNPVHDKIFVQYDGVAQLLLLDMNGKLLSSTRHIGQQSCLSIANLSNGIYFFKVIDAVSNQSFSRKIVVRN